MTLSRPPLHKRAGEVWLTYVDDVPADRLAGYRDLLDAGERARFDRFKVAGARTEFLLGRALLRSALSAHHSSIAPAEWRFLTNEYGRPHVAGPIATPVSFNLSHTRGLIALVLGMETTIGVDVEWIARGAPGDDLARRYFTAAEAKEIADGASEAERTERFFALWTLKEAYIKARGMGLALPLDGFFFDCGEDDPTIAFVPSKIDDHSSRWRLERRIAAPDHRLALALPAEMGDIDFLAWVPEDHIPERVKLPKPAPFRATRPQGPNGQ